jgi:hypothetical protein
MHVCVCMYVRARAPQLNTQMMIMIIIMTTMV